MSHPAQCPAEPSRIADTHCTAPTLKRATRRSQHHMDIKMFVGQVVWGHRFKRPSGSDGFRLAAAKKELSSRMNDWCSSDSNNDYWRDKLMDHKFLLRCARRVSEHEGFTRRTKDDSKSKRKPRHRPARRARRRERLLEQQQLSGLLAKSADNESKLESGQVSLFAMDGVASFLE